MRLHSFPPIIAVLLALFHDARSVPSSMEIIADGNCECGKSDESIGTRIVNGEEASPHSSPWAVPILNKGKVHCGGAIINDRYILTAGHCVRWTNHADLTVALGVHDLQHNNYTVAEIETIKLHENFTSNFLRDVNDLALLKLKEPIKMSEDVQVVCLPTEEMDYSDSYVKVVGWGSMVRRGPTSNILRETTLRVIPFSECQKAPFAIELTESMLCAYQSDTDACQGDSGGPLVRRKNDGRYEIIGVVSWGLDCAIKDIPGVYVKNIDYMPWIMYNSRDGTFCDVKPDPMA